MVPELGLFSLWLAFGIALGLSILPILGTYSGHRSLLVLDRPLSYALFASISASFGFLATSFLNDDFSVAYVANHSNTLLPWYYKITAVWGSHEGSMLFQIWTLSIWILAFSLLSRSLSEVLRARILSVLGLIALALIAFALFTSSPFDRLLPFPAQEGADLNPLLQDFGMIIHPPLLYIGYVGFGVSFAFAVAAMLDGRLDAGWVRWSRPWALGAWLFLTAGITIGSWWAYAELGWGGWWFWDPVENASLMPWLVGAALVHSLSVTEQRGAFKAWTLLLSLTAFSLSLLGAFLVRSGVVTSVHAFATDPDRGLFILGILAITVGGSLTLFALRQPKASIPATYGVFSREFMLLLNNILLMVITFIVFLGTLWPLLADAFDLGKISVGPTYFNRLANPVFILICLLMPIAPLMKWRANRFETIAHTLYLPIGVAIIAGALAWIVGGLSLGGILIWVVGIWVIAASLIELHSKSGGFDLKKLRRVRGGIWGMIIAHCGVGVATIGVGMTSLYSVEADVRMGVSGTHELSGYTFQLDRLYTLQGPNYISEGADVSVYKEGEQVATLLPEKRRYLASGQIMTEAGIDDKLSRDLYIALGEPLGNGDWAVRLRVKPFMRWVWLGGLLIALGAAFSMFDKRYRKQGARG